MSADGTTISQIESCLTRLNTGDSRAWEELFQHAFDRLLEQCGRIVHQQLSRNNPLITQNTVLAEAYQRLRTAMENENVRPQTAREFFGLAARNIRWQIQDMLRKRSEQQGSTDVFAQITGGREYANHFEDNEKWELFWSAVNAFDGDEREVFDLIWINELSQYEAATAIGKSRNQVDSIWRRIKLKIGKACKDYPAFDL